MHDGLFECDDDRIVQPFLLLLDAEGERWLGEVMRVCESITAAATDDLFRLALSAPGESSQNWLFSVVAIRRQQHSGATPTFVQHALANWNEILPGRRWPERPMLPAEVVLGYHKLGIYPFMEIRK